MKGDNAVMQESERIHRIRIKFLRGHTTETVRSRTDLSIAKDGRANFRRKQADRLRERLDTFSLWVHSRRRVSLSFFVRSNELRRSSNSIIEGCIAET